jgi:hypothetical protein
MDRKVVGVVVFGVGAMGAVITTPQRLGVVGGWAGGGGGVVQL